MRFFKVHFSCPFFCLGIHGVSQNSKSLNKLGDGDGWGWGCTSSSTSKDTTHPDWKLMKQCKCPKYQTYICLLAYKSLSLSVSLSVGMKSCSKPRLQNRVSNIWGIRILLHIAYVIANTKSSWDFQQTSWTIEQWPLDFVCFWVHRWLLGLSRKLVISWYLGY